jgi:hypothetical protein
MKAKWEMVERGRHHRIFERGSDCGPRGGGAGARAGRRDLGSMGTRETEDLL